MILLGGGLLLLGSALILALAPRPLSEARRAVAAVPLLTLAVLPSTINRPPGVYVHGLLLFGLLALFVWGERLDQDDGAVVVGVAAIAAARGNGVRAGAGHAQAVGQLPGADQQPGARRVGVV